MKTKTTNKLFAILLSLIMVLGMLPVSVFAVDLPIITGNSVYRSSATAATVKMMSDTNGTAYYKITDSEAAPSTSDLAVWTNAGEATANTTKNIDIAGLTSGAKYVHLVVSVASGISNVLTVSIPQDYYYYEDFEAYPENTYVAQSGSPLAPISQQHGGNGNTNQKVVSASGNNFFSLTSSETASVQRINLPSNYRDGAGRLVLKGKVMPLSEGPTYHEAAMFGIGDRKNGVLFISGKICYTNKADINNITYSFNQWYEIELDINLTTNKYDIKVDGTTIAANVAYNDSEKYVCLFAGHSTTAYFDDISFYTINENLLQSIEGKTVNVSDTVYNGNEQKQPVTIEGLVEGTDFDVTYSADCTNVGTVTVTVTGTGNYFGTITNTYEINKGTKAAPAGVAGVATSYFDTADGKITGVTTAMEYKLSTAEVYTAVSGTEITGLASGTYHIRYAENSNYNTSDYVTIIVSSGGKYTATLEFKSDLSLDKTYDGTAVSLGASDYTYTGDGQITITWYKDNAGVKGEALASAPENAGTYWVGISAAEGSAYNAVSEITKQFVIGKATYNMSGITLENGVFTYDGTAHSIAINGTLPTGVSVDYTNNEQINATASPVTVTAAFTGDSTNYNAIDDITATITINRAIPVYQIPMELVAKEGQKLANVAFPTAAGGAVWSWEDSTKSVGTAGRNKFTAEYNPNDDNYKPVMVDVIITVDKYNTPTPEKLEIVDVTVENGDDVSVKLIGLDEKYNVAENGDGYSIAAPAGDYQLEVTAMVGGVKTTVSQVITISDSSVLPTITLPDVERSTVVDRIGTSTPNIIVDGLNEVAEANQQAGQKIEIKLSVEKKAEDTTEGSDHKKIRSETENSNIDFFDIKLTSQIGDDTSPSYISDIGDKVLEIIIPFDASGKKDIRVYRKHGANEVELFDKVENRITAPTGSDDGRYFVGNGFIAVYAKQFSAYAIGYDLISTSTDSGGGGSPRYTVKFETNGGNSVSSKRVTRNSAVSEPTAPTKEGFTFDGWYTDEKLTEKYDFAQKVTKGFTLYAKWVENEKPVDPVDPTEWKNPFTDVKESNWYYDVVKEVYEKALMNGVSETEFAPDAMLTRAMFVTVLYRIEGEPEAEKSIFADLESGAYYENAAAWAAANGIVNGVSETEFAPNNNITREQMAAILFRYAKFKGIDVLAYEDTNILSYNDKDLISEYAIPAIEWACGAGIISGKPGGILDPLGNATRAEAAAMLVRISGLIK